MLQTPTGKRKLRCSFLLSNPVLFGESDWFTQHDMPELANLNLAFYFRNEIRRGKLHKLKEEFVTGCFKYDIYITKLGLALLIHNGTAKKSAHYCPD